MYREHVLDQRLTARSLFGTTFSLLQEHPALALPVAGADLLGFAAMHLQHALHQPLFDLVLAPRKSALSLESSPFLLTPQNAMKAELLAVPLIWGASFLTFYFYAAALAVVSRLIETVRDRRSLQFRLAVSSALRKGGRLFSFAIRISGLVLGTMALISLAFWLSMKVPALNHQIGRTFGYILGTIAEIPAFLLLGRFALKFLRREHSPLPPSNQRLAYLSCVLCVAGQLVITIALAGVPSSFYQQTSVPGLLLREAVQSLIGAAPYIPLFIALSLLSTFDSRPTDADVDKGDLPFQDGPAL